MINGRQFSWLTAAILTGGGLIGVEQILIRLGRMDAWGSYALSSLYVILIAYLFYQLSRRFPGKHLFEINKLLFGSALGTLINLVLIFHIWIILMRELQTASKLIGITLLPNTPDEILLLMLVLVMMYYGKTSVEVVARVTDFFFPFFVSLILILPLLLSNELNKSLLQPVLSGHARSLFMGNMVSVGWYGDIFVMGAFLHTLQASRQLRSALRHGAFISSLLLSLFLLLELLVLGPVIPGNMIFPNTSLIQQIHITDFLDRVDLVVLSLWYPVSICKTIIIYLAFLTGIASLVKQRDYSTINTPIALLLSLTALLAFKNAGEVFTLGHYSYPLFVLAYQPALFLVIWLLSLRHPVREQEKSQAAAPGQKNAQGGNDGANQANETSNPSGQGSSDASGAQQQNASTQKNRTVSSNGKRNPAPGLLQRLSYRAWVRWSNVLVVLNIIFILLGLWSSMHYSMLGVVCALAYAACTILVVLTSYMELFHTKQQSS